MSPGGGSPPPLPARRTDDYGTRASADPPSRNRSYVAANGRSLPTGPAAAAAAARLYTRIDVRDMCSTNDSCVPAHSHPSSRGPHRDSLYCELNGIGKPAPPPPPPPPIRAAGRDSRPARGDRPWDVREPLCVRRRLTFRNGIYAPRLYNHHYGRFFERHDRRH